MMSRVVGELAASPVSTESMAMATSAPDICGTITGRAFFNCLDLFSITEE
jgi:hypothetical protein